MTENSVERNLDDEIVKICDRLQLGEDKHYELSNGLVYRKVNDRLLFYVPKCMQENIIRVCNEQVGLQGLNKTLEYLFRIYWFPDARKKIQNHIMSCLKCITYATNTGRVEGKLHCPDKGNRPFLTLHIDHYAPLEKSGNRHKYIFEVIDAFTKFTKLYATSSTNSDEVITHLKNYFQNYSKPRKIVSGRGIAFTSAKFEEFLKENNIQHVLIAAGTPHANGQIERC